MVVHSTSFLDSKGHTPNLPPIPPLERMLGLNPQFQGAHPFHSMMGLHAANMNAAMAAAASQANNPSGGPPPPPPISTPSSMPSPGGPRGPRDLSGPPPGPPGPPPHPMNAGLNMWLNMWQHLNNKRTSLLPQLSIAKMDPLSQVFCLKWNNHQNNLLTVLDHLYQTEAFCDVTLACDNTSIKCHKMILSACSSYFQTLFMENTCEHPIVFLKDIKIGEVRAILDYMYKGEVNIAQEELPGLLKVAELLRVKGLVEGEGDKLLNANFGKNGRPPVSTALNEPPTSSSKLNGGDRDMPASFGSSSSDRRSISENRSNENRENRERERDNNANSKSDLRPFGLMGHAQGNMPMPMFPLPGMFPNLLGARDQVPPRMTPGGSREDVENDREGSPSPPGSGGKRRKVASGSGGSCSSKESGPLGHADQRSIALDLARERQERDSDKGLHGNMDKDDGLMGLPPGLDKSGIANYVPSQRLEWKRYKQYTRNDIMSAIEEVKAGMSALQASRKYGVPSRTLYDKVKKMGITTGRQVQRKSLPDYPSQFPGLGRNMMLNDLEDRGDTNDSSEGAPGDVMEGRATMVPPTSLSTYMLNIMKGIREPDHSKDGEISLTALNLSTMLPSSAKNSLSPRSPRSSQHPPSSQHRDLEIDDTVDSTGRHRHSSGSAGADNEADIKSQFLADLRRLGSHIPTQTGNGNSNSSEPVSTTHSPPAAPASSGSGPPSTPTKMEDGDLPPRKRKVSQEHQVKNDRESPYNGVVSQSQEDLKTENNEAIQASN